MRRATWGRCVSGRCCGVRESSSQPLTPKGTAPLLHCPDPRKARATFHGACPRRTRMAMPVALYIDAGGPERLPSVTGQGRIRHPLHAHRGRRTPVWITTPPPGAGPAVHSQESRRAGPGTSAPSRALHPAPDRYRPAGRDSAARRRAASFRTIGRPTCRGAQRSGRSSGLCAGRLTESRTHNHLFSANFTPLSLPCRIGRSTPLPPGRKRPRGTLPPDGDGP